LPRSSGTYTQPANTAAVANSTASSTAFNTLITDISTALTDSLPVDGTKAMAAALPMGSNKITGLAVGTALTEAASITQVQNRTVAWADGGGTADAITATYSPTVTALVDGMVLGVRATAANATTTPTFAPDGLTARIIVKGGGSALAAGDIAGDGHDLELRYNSAGTPTWSLLNPFPAAAAGASSATTTLAGVSELATTTEILAGTETANVTATPDSIAALWEQGTTLSSASTLSFGEGGMFHVTGTTTVTDIDFATTKAGRSAIVVFEGALILTHNATTLILPTGANITTAAGDCCRVVSEGGDNVRVTSYMRASGAALSAPSSTVTVIKKSGDESVSNSTLQNDDDFTFSLAANTKYLGEIVLHLDTNDADDEGFKFDITGPASPTSVTYGIHGAADDLKSDSSGQNTESATAAAFSTALTVLTANSAEWFTILRVPFYINNGVNSGTFQFRWAKGSGTTACVVLGRSYMSYQIVS
jgi:hypothetical protein